MLISVVPRAGCFGRWLLAVALMMASACSRQPAPAQTTATPPTAGPRTIDVVRVVEQPLDVTLTMPAELNAFQTVAIYPRVTGFVKSVAVDRGTRVRAGTLLVVLEAPELVAQRSESQSKLQAAQAQLAVVRTKADASQATFERLKAASATPGVVAGNDLVLAQKAVEADVSQIAAAEQSVEAARQALAALREMEGYLRITAPFDGVITERAVHPGALVGPSSGSGSAPMLRLVQERQLRLIVPVPEAYIAGIAAGTSVPFTVAAYPAETFSGRVARIARAVDVQTRTMAVELDVMNADGRLAPGNFAQVRWPVRRTRPSLMVPTGSIATTTGRTFVVRVNNGRADWVDVTTGLTAGRMVEVFGDLHAGDQVAVRGTDEIQAGTAIATREVNAPTPS
jgi:membrane fusion protein, multidrug efflux system